MGRGAWWVTVHGVTISQTQMSELIPRSTKIKSINGIEKSFVFYLAVVIQGFGEIFC